MKSNKSHGEGSRPANRARTRAMVRLSHMFKKEFLKLYAEECLARGVKPRVISANPKKKAKAK